MGITIVDAGHFKTENVITEPLRYLLKQKFKNTEFAVSEVFSDKIKYL